VGGNQTTFANIVTNMQTKGVTSVVCFCQRGDIGDLQEDADAQTYFPEWIVTTEYWNDFNFSMRSVGGRADQMSHLFGLTVQPMQRQFQDHPSTWANPGSGYATDAAQITTEDQYHNLLLIASGLQMAGPHLTPQSFQDGLQQAVFPNPETPLNTGHVGFNGGSHAMTVDAAEMWWSTVDAGPGQDEPQGSGGVWCYVDHGARHSLTNPWPAGDPFFQEPCDSGNEPANWSG
jgi:hypothetical protein